MAPNHLHKRHNLMPCHTHLHTELIIETNTSLLHSLFATRPHNKILLDPHLARCVQTDTAIYVNLTVFLVRQPPLLTNMQPWPNLYVRCSTSCGQNLATVVRRKVIRWPATEIIFRRWTSDPLLPRPLKAFPQSASFRWFPVYLAPTTCGAGTPMYVEAHLPKCM